MFFGDRQLLAMLDSDALHEELGRQLLAEVRQERLQEVIAALGLFPWPRGFADWQFGLILNPLQAMGDGRWAMGCWPGSRTCIDYDHLLHHALHPRDDPGVVPKRRKSN